MKDHQNCINPAGKIDIRFLASEEDAINTFAYSLRKTVLEDQDWKYLSEHCRNKHPNMNPSHCFQVKSGSSNLRVGYSCFRPEADLERLPSNTQKPCSIKSFLWQFSQDASRKIVDWHSE